MKNKFGFFDTHFHLFEERFKTETNFSEDELIKKANKNNVEWICNVGTTLKDSRLVIEQAKRHHNVIAAIGCHPNYSNKWNKDFYKELELLLNEKKVMAIGEIGLDYYRTFSSKKEQEKCFKEQLELSKKYNLPVLLHLRNAYEDAIKIIFDFKINNGIVHCFSGTLDQANKFIELGFLISISGIVTFFSAKNLQEIVKKIPLEKIVIETDAPYLTPIPHRGKINFSEYIKYTAEKIAKIKNISLNKVVEQTTKNALNLFKIKI